jgi:hypothetical protein
VDAEPPPSDPEPDPGPWWAVVDPDSADAAKWHHALGTDAVELASPVLHGLGEPRRLFFQVAPLKLKPGQLIRLCRHVANQNRVTFAWTYVNAVVDAGIVIPASEVYLCRDPAKGRDWYSFRFAVSQPEEGGGP